MEIDLGAVLGGLLAAGGSGATIAIAVTRAFGEKWLENRFSQRLEALKHQQAQEMEQIRYRVAGLLDRGSKLNQREFEVLPELWRRIDHAFVKTREATENYIVSFKFERLSPEEVDEIVAAKGLPERAAIDIRQAHGPKAKEGLFVKAYLLKLVLDAHAAVVSAFEALRQSSIFINPETYVKLSSFLDMITAATRARRSALESGSESRNDPDIKNFRQAGPQAHEEMLSFLRNRFWNTTDDLTAIFAPLR